MCVCVRVSVSVSLVSQVANSQSNKKRPPRSVVFLVCPGGGPKCTACISQQLGDSLSLVSGGISVVDQGQPDGVCSDFFCELNKPQKKKTLSHRFRTCCSIYQLFLACMCGRWRTLFPSPRGGCLIHCRRSVTAVEDPSSPLCWWCRSQISPPPSVECVSMQDA